MTDTANASSLADAYGGCGVSQKSRLRHFDPQVSSQCSEPYGFGCSLGNPPKLRFCRAEGNCLLRAAPVFHEVPTSERGSARGTPPRSLAPRVIGVHVDGECLRLFLRLPLKELAHPLGVDQVPDEPHKTSPTAFRRAGHPPAKFLGCEGQIDSIQRQVIRTGRQ